MGANQRAHEADVRVNRGKCVGDASSRSWSVLALQAVRDGQLCQNAEEAVCKCIPLQVAAHARLHIDRF